MIGRRLEVGSVEGRRQSGVGAGRLAGLHGQAAGIVREVNQAQALGAEQLVKVGMTDRRLVRSAQGHAVRQAPERAELEGVGAVAGGVVGIAVSGVETEILQHRNAQFGEVLVNVISAGQRQRGAAGTGAVARPAGQVGTEIGAQVLGLGADCNRNRAGGAGNRQRSVAGNHGLNNALPAGSENEGGIGDVALQLLTAVDHALDAAVARQPAAEEVVGSAAGVGSIQRRHAGGRAVDADHVDGPVDRGDGKVVAVLAGVFHVGQLVGQVVAPAVGEVAAHAHDRDHVIVSGDVLARAAFDVAL